MNATETAKALRDLADRIERDQPPGDSIRIDVRCDAANRDSLIAWAYLMRAHGFTPASRSSNGTFWIKGGDFQSVEIVAFYSPHQVGGTADDILAELAASTDPSNWTHPRIDVIA